MKKLIALLLLCTGCSLSAGEQKAGAQFVSDAAVCIKTQASMPQATPQGVALTCGLELVPDLLAIIESVISAPKATDAGVD